MSALKAYQVDAGESDLGTCSEVVFATNSATARRKGAAKLDTDWEGVDSCRRVPVFDQYAPGPVPVGAMIEAGWWYSCHGCGIEVSTQAEQFAEEEGEERGPYVTRGLEVFCCLRCQATDDARRRGRKAAEHALVELVTTYFPGSDVIRAHVYGDRLEASEPGQALRHQSSAYFTFPGGRYPATYQFGDGGKAYVNECDVAAFEAAFRRGRAA